MLKKLFRFAGRLLKHLSRGEFALAFHKVAAKFPCWLLDFDQAYLLVNDIDRLKFPENMYTSHQVRTATIEDAELIAGIDGWPVDHIRELLGSGAQCFMAAPAGEAVAAINWIVYSRCFVRGIGLTMELQPGEFYGGGAMTKPEYRGQGLFLSLNKAITDCARKRGLTRYWIMIELTNLHNMSIRSKMGFDPRRKVTYFRLFGLKICRLKDLQTGAIKTKFFTGMPSGDLTYF